MAVDRLSYVHSLQYVAGIGAKIPNLGGQNIPLLTCDVLGASWLFQVAGVDKPLVSVAKLIEEGWNSVVRSRDSPKSAGEFASETPT